MPTDNQALAIAGTIVTAFVTGAFGYAQHQATQRAREAEAQATERAKEAERQATERAEIAADRQLSIQNGRDAASMYFDKLGDLRAKDDLTPGEKLRFARDLEIVAAISGNEKLEPVLMRVAREAAVATRAAAPAGQAPSVALQGLPDLTPRKAAPAYRPQDFVAYPQCPAAMPARECDRLRSALAQLGFDAQPVERVPTDRSPAENEIRYYKAEHQTVARNAAAELERTTGQDFTARRIGGASLPNGVIEFWLGSRPRRAVR